MYRNRKKVKDDVKVKVDLTRRRLRILTEPIKFGKSNNRVDFVFADVNCKLVAKLINGSYVLFDSPNNLEQKLNDLG